MMILVHNLFELVDEISLRIIDKENCVDSYVISIPNVRQKESEISDKINELRIYILSILVKRSNVVFVAQWYEKTQR